MWRRVPDVAGCTLLLIRLTIGIFLAKYLDAQQLPPRDRDYGFGINKRNLFYDTNRIPDSLQVEPYLFVNATKKFFFLLESTIDRLDITVSPCASPIIWHVSYKPWYDTTAKYDLENDVESTILGFQPVIDTRDVLYTLSGEISETLRLDDPRPGVYTLDVTSIKSDSYVQVFVTTSPLVHRYPELPVDYNVSELEQTSRGVTVAWHPSPDERHFGSDIEYCVSLNKKQSFKTICSVTSHLHGDQKPTLPPGNGFGFSNESDKRRILKQTAKPIKAARKGSIFFKCIGQQKKYTFDRLSHGRGYYIDVFVRNNKSEFSRQYRTLYVKTKRKESLPSLRNGRTKKIDFTKKVHSRSYLFKIKKRVKHAYIAINAYSGKTLVEVSNSNGTIYKSRVQKSKLLILKDLKPDKYVLKLSKSAKRRISLYVSVTSKSRKAQMPSLPVDTTVKVFDYLTSCNSITVAWQGTEKKQIYCLYKTEVSSLTSRKKGVSKKQNQYGAMNRLENGAQKITCKKFRYGSKERAVLAITVTGLNPDSSYIFDIFVSKGKSFSFPYNSVRTKTGAQCYLPT